jgi:peptidylprolyl isomerase
MMKTKAFVPVLLLVATMAGAETKPIPAPADVAAPPADAETTASGLASKVIAAGGGQAHPAKTDKVTVHYTGWTTDGKMFDSSRTAGKPATFPLDKVIAGWTEGVQLMVAGEKRRFWIPAKLAYDGQEGRPQGTLVFDVELVSFEPANPFAPPADLKKPPTIAKKTWSGVSYLVLKPGSGKKPGPKSEVTVNYTGWTTDGKMFDSSIPRREPTTFKADQVIEGWTEGLQLMAEGGKMRFWIPENLAYKGEKEPLGMLVFDVELLKVKSE